MKRSPSDELERPYRALLLPKFFKFKSLFAAVLATMVLLFGTPNASAYLNLQPGFVYEVTLFGSEQYCGGVNCGGTINYTLSFPQSIWGFDWEFQINGVLYDGPQSADQAFW